MMQLRLTTKVSSVDLENIGQGHISKRVISQFLTDLNQIFFKNDDAATGLSRLCVPAQILFTLDNCLLNMDAPHKPAI